MRIDDPRAVLNMFDVERDGLPNPEAFRSRIIEHLDRVIAELEAENERLTAATKRMYDKWMACFDAARKAEAALADREQTIQRVRELAERIDALPRVTVDGRRLPKTVAVDDLFVALDAAGT